MGSLIVFKLKIPANQNLLINRLEISVSINQVMASLVKIYRLND